MESLHDTRRSSLDLSFDDEPFKRDNDFEPLNTGCGMILEDDL
jgi:hypothetical protein